MLSHSLCVSIRDALCACAGLAGRGKPLRLPWGGVRGRRPTEVYRQTAHRGRPPGRPETRLAPHLMQKTMSLRSQCAHWLWQSALPDYGLASGGSLSFCGERKGGKNAAKTKVLESFSRLVCHPRRSPLTSRTGMCKICTLLSHGLCGTIRWPLTRARAALTHQGNTLRLPRYA